MTARCASCSYPLTISDSIACYECRSYFHIDCAQLVGFPYYELSSDPNRNTFHCATCELLPLPQPQCDSDSDSDSEMPSRQLDYALESQSDFAKEIFELKGSVQDISELCKDMLREINDLKSINLTLRCCVENLKHDNEERDVVISDLKRRLSTIEKNERSVMLKNTDSENFSMDRLCIEREEDTERYMTPEPDFPKVENIEQLQVLGYDHPSIEKEGDFPNRDEIALNCLHTEEIQEQQWGAEHEEVLEEVSVKKHWETYTKDIAEIEEDKLDYERIGKETLDININVSREPSIEIKADDAIKEVEEDRHDWAWKGNKAIELDKASEQDEIEKFAEGCEERELEECSSQEWEMLDKEIESGIATEVYEDELQMEEESENLNLTYNRENEYNEWDAKIKGESLLKEEEDLDTNQGEYEQSICEDEDIDDQIDEAYLDRRFSAQNEDLDHLNAQYAELELKEDETQLTGYSEEDVHEYEAEKSIVSEVDKSEMERSEVDKVSLEGKEIEDHVETESDKVSQGLEGEMNAEGEALAEVTPRLEDNAPQDLEGEQVLGGQSPVEGEVQPTEPPPPTEPAHTEEDLWDYLKETVTSVHPATVEEFVQNLIGTLQHVPEEYLKPVIDANIKRATSPSVTDGEHLTTLDGVPLVEGVEVLSGNTKLPEEVIPLTTEDEVQLNVEEDFTPTVEGEASATKEESAVPTDEPPSAFPQDEPVPEEPEDVEGYSASEAAA